jgi:hypothetical protein
VPALQEHSAHPQTPSRSPRTGHSDASPSGCQPTPATRSAPLSSISIYRHTCTHATHDACQATARKLQCLIDSSAHTYQRAGAAVGAGLRWCAGLLTHGQKPVGPRPVVHLAHDGYSLHTGRRAVLTSPGATMFTHAQARQAHKTDTSTSTSTAVAQQRREQSTQLE